MFIEPPRRELTKYVTGKGPKPIVMDIADCDAAPFVKAFKEVCSRDNRTCNECGAEFLYQPKLKLWVRNTGQYFYDADNLECVCQTCAHKRVAEQRLTTAAITGFVRDAVVKREGFQCIYCLAQPLRGDRAEVVGVVDDPSEADPNDWACSCKTCANARGMLSHETFLEQRRRYALNLLGHLTDELDVMRGA